MPEITRLTAAGSLSFKRRSLEPPVEARVRVEDVIQFGAETLVAHEVTFRARIQQPTGEIVLFQETRVLALNTNVKVFFRLIDGFLLGAAISTNSDFLKHGECYVWAHMVSTGAQDESTARVLIGNYIAAQYPAGWPESPIMAPGSGPGAEQVDGDTPGLGEEFDIVASTNVRARVRSVTGVLTTDATAGDRFVAIQLTTAFNAVLFQSKCATAQPASSTVRYTCLSGGGSGVIHSNSAVLPGPMPLFLPVIHKLSSKTEGLQAGDQWTQVQSQAEVWAVPFFG
jgi:hypothetical protein